MRQSFKRFKKLLDVKKIREFQAYILAITLFYTIIINLPTFKNAYTLPKLIVIQVGASIIILIEAVRLLFLEKKIILKRNDLFLLIFLGLNFLAMIFSGARTVSFFGFYQVETLAFYYLPAILISAFIYKNLPEKSRNLIKIFIVGAVFLSSLQVIYRYFIVLDAAGIRERPRGVEGHPIWTSAIIIYGLLVLVGLRINIFLKIGLAIFFLWALVILDSSTSWISLILAAAIVLLLIFKKKLKPNFKSFIAFCLIASLVISFYFYHVSKSETFSIKTRIIELKTAFNLLNKDFLAPSSLLKNLTFGFGQNTAGMHYLKYRDPSINLTKEWYFNLVNIHNHFLELLLTTGVFSFLVWFFLFLSAIRNASLSGDYKLLLLLLFLFFWQMLYVFVGSLYLLAWLALVEGLKEGKFLDKNIASFKINRNNKVNFAVLLILVAVNLVFAVKILAAEYYFSQGQYQKAVKLNSNNDNYLTEELSWIQKKLIACQLTAENKKSCRQADLESWIKEGKAAAEEAVKINPLNPSNWSAKNMINFFGYLVSSRRNKKLLDEAFYAAKKAVEIDPTDATFTDNLGLLYLEAKNYPKAQEYFLKAHQLKPDSRGPISHLIELYKQLGSYEEQQQYLNLLNNNSACRIN